MNKNVKAIRRHLSEYEKTADCIDLEIRLSLAQIVIRHMNERKITVGKLAKLTGYSTLTIEKIMFGDVNWSCKMAGKILHALGTRARLEETDAKSK